MKIVFVVALSSAMLMAGCGRRVSVGRPASPDTPATALQAILAAPREYHGQTVVLDGRVGAQCASGCGFTYREGRDSVKMFVEGTETPRLSTGQRVRVTVTVHHGEHQTIFTAVGLELLPGKEGA